MNEIQKENEAVNATVSENSLDDRLKDIERREIRLSASEEITRRGLTKDVIDLLDTSSKERCLESLNRLEKLIRSEAARLRDESLKQRGMSLPGGAASMDFDSLSDREYYALTLRKRH